MKFSLGEIMMNQYLKMIDKGEEKSCEHVNFFLRAVDLTYSLCFSPQKAGVMSWQPGKCNNMAAQKGAGLKKEAVVNQDKCQLGVQMCGQKITIGFGNTESLVSMARAVSVE